MDRRNGKTFNCCQTRQMTTEGYDAATGGPRVAAAQMEAWHAHSRAPRLWDLAIVTFMRVDGRRLATAAWRVRKSRIVARSAASEQPGNPIDDACLNLNDISSAGASSSIGVIVSSRPLPFENLEEFPDFHPKLLATIKACTQEVLELRYGAM